MGGRVEFANALRGLAALSVLVSHYLGVFWVSPSTVADLTGLTRPDAPAPLLTGWVVAAAPLNFGAFGVALFFVVSGFVIPFSFRSYGRLDFLTGRLFRIYPTYWVGLTASLALLAVCDWLLSAQFPHSAREILFGYLLGARDIAWVKNVDGVVWTLEVELKFYLVCALIAPWLRRGSLLAFLAPIALLALACWLGAMMPSTLLLFAALSSPYLIFMFVGVAFNYLHRGELGAGSTAAVVIALVAMFEIAQRFGFFRVDVLPSYGAAVVIFALAMRLPRLVTAIPGIGFCADISYPLYLVHALTGYSLMPLLLTLGLPPALVVTAAAGFTTALAYLLHVYVEMPSHDRGRSLMKGRPQRLTGFRSAR